MLDREQLTSDLLTDYALGFLGEHEAQEVEAALARYPDANAELGLYLSGLSDLAIDLGPAELPAGAEERLMARLNAEVIESGIQSGTLQPDLPPQQPRPQPTAAPAVPPVRRNLLYPLLALAAAIALALVLLPNLNRSDPNLNSSNFARYQAQAGAVTSTLTDKAGAKVADVVRLPDGRVYVQAQADVPAGRSYQAWKIEGGKPVSLGLFSGKGFLGSVPAGTVFAISVEPQGGSIQPTTTPVFAGAI